MKSSITELYAPARPVKILQFGGGVFLRGFFDWMLQKANDAGVYCGNAVIVRQMTRGDDPLASQSFRYTHLARGADGVDATVINSISGSVSGETAAEFYAYAESPELSMVVSNTTEAGIVYEACPMPEGNLPDSYPARLAALLCRRYKAGQGGLLILPCELIENNGDTLREIVLRHASDWGMGGGFAEYVTKTCDFRNTLVDRIVSGKPSEPVELAYTDNLVNTSESFCLFAIEGEPDGRLPFEAAGVGIRFVPDLSVIRRRKVRILNGAHTSMIPYACRLGIETVGDCMADPEMTAFLSGCLSEILISLGDGEEAKTYADEVLRRFSNPYIRHLTSAIALNSVSKFKVRCLPSIKEYHERTGSYPKHLLYSFAQLLRFYRECEPKDAPEVISAIRGRELAEVLADASLWGEDLSALLPDVAAAASAPSWRGAI